MTIETRPLAERVRPQKLNDFYGLEQLYQKYPFIQVMVEKQFYRSSIFYGPSGSGKTTFAHLLTEQSNIPVMELNAVSANKSDIIDVIEQSTTQPVVLILDEIHRLNKDKQEVLLPVIESGAVVLFGLTTVHPYSSLPASIRSRVQIYHFEENSDEIIIDALQRALEIDEILLGFNRTIDSTVLSEIAQAANGDIRFAMNTLETVIATSDTRNITLENITNNTTSHLNIENTSNNYDLLSALQKSIRGSDPDAALYWLIRILDTDDMSELCRRLLVIAFEDIAFGYPGVCDRTVSAITAAEKIGLPEAIYPLGYIVSELALAPKSRTIYDAISKAKHTVQTYGNLPIPEILKMRTIDRSEFYKYDDVKSWETITYLPDKIKKQQLYDFSKEYRSSKFEEQMKQRYQQLSKKK